MPPTEPDRMTAIETTLWGRFGSNGINAEVRRNSEKIGDLYGRDETLRIDIDARIARLDERLNDGLSSIYRLITTLLGTVLVSTIGIVLTMVLT